MNKLLSILSGLHPETDFATATDLIDGEILDSFDIITLVSEIDDQFSVVIPPAELTPENFNSAAALYRLIRRLSDRPL